MNYDQIRAITDAVETANRVEVNQRALIDKILARYATASAVYRELIQNSNDAGATIAEIHFTTTATNNNNSASSGSNSSSTSSINNTGQVKQVTYRNNGMPFRKQDWDRLQKIAEGNPDVSKVGAFGVGAYSMFSITEEPVVVSGTDCLLFCWKGDALYTKIAPNTNITKWTTFLLPSRDIYPLPNWDEFGSFLASALTFTASLQTIIVTVDNIEKLHIQKIILQKPRIVQTPDNALTAANSKASFFWNTIISSSNSDSISTSLQSPLGMFTLQDKDSILESVVRITVTVEKTTSAYMDAQYVSAIAKTNISSDMTKRMERVTKKQPPPTVTVQVFMNFNEPMAKLLKHNNNNNKKNNKNEKLALYIAQSFAPQSGNGKIFIGFRTSQTTGLAAHLAAPFIPTVEREAMDLQDPILAKFNGELLQFSGILLRLTLEHTMRNIIHVNYIANEKERIEIENKLLLKEQQQQKSSGGSSNHEEVDNDDEEKEDGESDDGTSSTTSGFMGFAKFMARGVKKKIVKVAKTIVEGGDGSEKLLHPPDPRPLSVEEQQAIVLMSSFCPQQSTPDPAVGTALAQGFSRCMPNSAPPVLTKSGVVPGDQARLPNNGIEGFISDNVIRTIVYENAKEYHTVIARCKKLNYEDLMEYVNKTIFEQEKMITLIKWWTRFSRIDAPHLTEIRGNRLKDNVQFYRQINNKNGNKGQQQQQEVVSSSTTTTLPIWKLGDIVFFVEKDSPFYTRDVPLPETVLPADIQDDIGYTVINGDALYDVWFSPFPVEIFAEYISHTSCMLDAKPEDELLRIKVLTVLSREYMRRYGADRSVFGSFCNSLLSDKRCIPFDSDLPTQYAAEYPADLYLYSAELRAFDGIGSFHKASAALQSAGVTEEFLLTLGVRKSVSIDFLFAHLDTLSWSKDPKPLIEYLRTATLTRNDLNKLSSTKYLPASDDSTKTYAPSELFLPNEDLTIFPFVKTLQWPAEPVLSEKSDNGKFLVKLGMRSLPSLSIVLAFLSGKSLTDEQAEKGLEFVCDRLGSHGAYYQQYNSMNSIERKKYPILPCIIHNPILSDAPLSQKQPPVTCFVDPGCGVMGFPVIDPKLGKKGKVYGSLFQCDDEPQTNYLLHQLNHLVAVAKDKMRSVNKGKEEEHALANRIEKAFAEIFKYLSHRSSDISYSALGSLKKESFIPCIVESKLHWFKPDEVFFKRSDSEGESLTAELFHVIDFNPFLAAVGVKENATTKEFFIKMVESPESVLQTLGSEKKYRMLLRRIAADPPFSRPPEVVKKSPFLLGYTVKHESEEKKDQADEKNSEEKLTYQLAKAEDIYIVDNLVYGRMFPVLRAPPESDLEDFYILLGSKFISKSIDRRFEVIGRPVSDTQLTKSLRERLRERGPLLVSPMVTSRPLVSGAAKIIDDKRLDFYEATNLLAVYTLGNTSRRNRTTCFSRPSTGKKNAIYITSDFDLFEVGQAIGDLILKRCQLEDAFFISSLLEAPLEQLRARGFPVDRILRPEPVVVPPKPTPKEEPAVMKTPIKQEATNNTPSQNGTIADIPPLKTPNEMTSSAPAAKSMAAKAPDIKQKDPPGKTGTKADILMQMFPDADPNFILAALGPNPSVDDVKDLAEKMSSGHYPKVDETDTNTVGTSDSSIAGTEADSPAQNQKKKSLRKRILGKAFGGKKGSAFGGAQLPPQGGNVESGHGGGGHFAPPQSTSQRHENRDPVAPATDMNSQNSLERMLEQSVGTTTNVQRNGIESQDTNLTSIPKELDKGETCEVIPGQSLTPFAGPRGNGKTLNGIQVFASKTHELTSVTFLTENEVSLELFSKVLENLCVNVFGVRLQSAAIYHDPAGVTIAFNSNRALHFNFRFFHALHYLQNKHSTGECYSYWFITICHELAHNFVSGHTREHGFYTESFAGHYLPKFTVLMRNLNLE